MGTANEQIRVSETVSAAEAREWLGLDDDEE